MDESLNDKPKMIIMPLEPLNKILEDYIILDDADKSILVDFKNYDIIKVDENLKKFLNVNFSNKENNDEYVVIDDNNSNNIPKFSKFNKFICNLSNSKERMFIVNYQYFYKDIKDSFTTTDIKKQFILDIVRCKYYINFNQVSKPEHAIEYYEYKYGKKKANKIMMLTTQALMGLPFQILQTSLYKDELYLAEIKDKDSKRRHHYIFVTAKDNDIHIVTKKYLRIFKLEDGCDTDLYYVEIQIEVNLDDKNSYEILIGYNFLNIEDEINNKVI